MQLKTQDMMLDRRYLSYSTLVYSILLYLILFIFGKSVSEVE